MDLFILLLAAGILLLILLIRSPGKLKQFKDKEGNVIMNSIKEKAFVKINGVRMGMIIEGKDSSNPVLLIIHGGPGMPEYFMNEKYPAGFNEFFTTVWWDQRGAGLSYSSDISETTMTSEQFVSDIIEVSKYLSKQFHQEKIYLLGHSWGTFIAIQAASRAPELYHAYIGVSQMVKQEESEKIAYEYMLDYYNQTGDKRTVRRLEKHPVNTAGYDTIRDAVMHKAGIGTMRKMTSVITGIFIPSLMNTEYTLTEKINLWKGKASPKLKALKEERNRTDISSKIKTLDLPVYFLSGVFDYTVNYKISEAYLKELSAPVKGFYLFEKSAHSPIFEESDKVRRIMLEDVLQDGNSLADIK